MIKSNSILAKAMNEADTIKAGALKNANELLFEMFQPKFKKMINNAVNEQTMSTQASTPDNFDPDASESNVENPEDTINVGGEGAPLTEQEDIEDPEEIVEVDEDEDDEKLDEQVNDEFIDEQEDEFIDEQNIDIDDEEILEQDDEITSDEEELDEASEFDALEDDDIVEIDDELLEGIEDEEMLEEADDDDVTVSSDEDVVRAANESRLVRKLKLGYRKLQRENLRLRKESKFNNNGINKLRSKLSEVNLFNQKLAYSLRTINNQASLSPNEKKNIISQFDNCKTLREVKITYNAINRFNASKNVKRNSKINENTRRMFSKINENKRTAGNNNSGSFDSRTLKMAGLD